jgi:hypothetical protein
MPCHLPSHGTRFGHKFKISNLNEPNIVHTKQWLDNIPSVSMNERKIFSLYKHWRDDIIVRLLQNHSSFWDTLSFKMALSWVSAWMNESFLRHALKRRHYPASCKTIRDCKTLENFKLNQRTSSWVFASVKEWFFVQELKRRHYPQRFAISL